MYKQIREGSDAMQNERREGVFSGISVRDAAAWVICIAAAVAAAWLLLRYATVVALPFLIAYLLALCIRPLARRLSRGRRVARRIFSAILVILLVGAVGTLVVWGCSRALSELGRLAAGISDDSSGISEMICRVSSWIRSLSDHLPFLDRFEGTPGFEEFCDRLDTFVQNAASNLLQRLSAAIPTVVMSILGSLPSALLFVTVLLLSCYYFCAEDGVGKSILHILPARVRDQLPVLVARGKDALRRYARAYLILGAITFVEMFIGLSVIGIPYAFIMAWVIAIVDFLPLFGSGTVLVPWAVLLLCTGSVQDGIGLLVLYAVALIVRQLVEPRLVSASLGLHPLASLVAMYAGWQLLGVWGLIAAPLVIMLAKGLWTSRAETEQTKTEPA